MGGGWVGGWVARRNADSRPLCTPTHARATRTRSHTHSHAHTLTHTHSHAHTLTHTHQGADYALRFHDLHLNRYVRYFPGHTGRVTALRMSPRSDAFLSAGEDRQVRLYDLRAPQCQALLQVGGGGGGGGLCVLVGGLAPRHH